MSVTIITSIGPVTLKEAYEGYEPGIDESSGPYLKKVYLCPTWASLYPVLNALWGVGTRPVSHPCPEAPNLRAVHVRAIPEGEYDSRDAGRPQFNLPKVEIVYAVPSYESVSADDPAGDHSFPADDDGPYLFMEQSIDWDVEVIKLPGRCYAFASDGKAVDAPVHRTIAVAQFVLVRKWQTFLPHANVKNYMNRLNDATFLGQPRGTIKFRKCQSRRTGSGTGERTQETAYTFLWREFDHNAQHRPDANYFELIQDADGANPYQYADLSALLS